MLELLCKISFFLFMLVMNAYVTSTREVIIIICGYILCVFSYFYFNAIKTAIDELLNYVQNHGGSKTNLSASHVPGYSVSKKYNKTTNAVNVPSMNSGVFSPVCRSKNVFPRNSAAVFNCKFNNFIMNGDKPSPIMTSGLLVENGNNCIEKIKLPMQSMKKGFNLSSLRFRNSSQSARNPFSSPKKYNNNLDMETYMNVKSPGFTGRIVDKALESASYHIKYPAVKQISAYRFDKNTLRHLSKIPRMNSTPLVRIAPPEPISLHFLNSIEKNLGKNEIIDSNFMKAMKDFSRKRNHSQEEPEKSTATAKKSRKNDVKNFTISQYKRTLEDKSRDVLEDKSKKRCDDCTRDATRMVVYAPSIASVSNSNLNSYSKKRKSSNKTRNECSASTEKCRRIDKSSKEICSNQRLNEAVSENYKFNSSISQISIHSKEVESCDQLMEQSQNEPIDDENFEYVRVASGKILNRTNRSYRRKLINNRIDPVSVIASEPEIVGEITGADDVSMREHLLQNLLNNIERKDHKDEKVIFYENSIIEEVAKKKTHSDEPQQQAPNLSFTDSFEYNEERIDMNISTNELEESLLNSSYLLNNKSYAISGPLHSPSITSNLRNFYSENGPNFTDSGYDTSSTENSINISSGIKEPSTPTSMLVGNSANENCFKKFSTSSETSFSTPSNGFGFTKYQSPAVTNSESKLNGLFRNASAIIFGSDEKTFFNSLNMQSNGSSRNNPEINTNSSNVFGSRNEEVSMQSELSFSSTTNPVNKTSTSNDPGAESMKNFSPNLQKQFNFCFGTSTPVKSTNSFIIPNNNGTAAIEGFTIGAEGSSRDRVPHNGRNK